MSASDDGFETSAQLSIEIPQSELRNARQQIESELGTTEIGMTDGGSMSAQAAGGGGRDGRERRRRRREYRWARERTNLTEDIYELLAGADLDELGGGGGGMLENLLGLGSGAAGGAIAGGTGALGIGAATGIGSAVGSAVGNALSGESVDVEEPNWTPLEVEEPGEIPVEELESISIEDPSPLDVEDPGSIPVDTPNEIGVEDPSPLDVADPSPLEVEDPPPLEVENPEWTPLPVEQPDPVSVTVTYSQGNGQTNDRGDTGGDMADRGPLDQFIRDRIEQGERIGSRADDALDRVPTFDFADDIGEGTEDTLRNINPFTSPEDGGGSQSGGTTSAQPAGGVTIEQITVDQQIDTEVVVDRIREVTDAIDDVEQSLEDGYDELEDELDDAINRIEDLEDALS